MAGGIKGGALTAAVIVYEKVTDDLVKKKTEEEIDLKGMKERLVEIETNLILIDKEPDEVMRPNIEKITTRRMFEQEKAQIEKVLNLCK